MYNKVSFYVLSIAG